MSQTLSQVRDHLTVVIGECDMLEDILSAQSDLVTRINVIRNAAYRVLNAIEPLQPSKLFAVDMRRSGARRAGDNVDCA